MKAIYRSAEGERQVRERYMAFLEIWPVEHQEFRVRTIQGETFVVACGDQGAPPLLLLHGGAGNCAMWIGDIAPTRAHFGFTAWT